MQACDHRSIEGLLLFTPNINVLRSQHVHVMSELLCLLHCTPLFCRVEVQSLWFSMSINSAPGTMQVLRSLPQSITWGPLHLRLGVFSQAQSHMQELCAAFAGTPLAQAVSKLTLFRWAIELPIAFLRASFPNVLHFELYDCPQFTASISETVAAWPMLRSVSHSSFSMHRLAAAQQHLEAAARTAAELKAGQPFEIVLQNYAASPDVMHCPHSDRLNIV